MAAWSFFVDLIIIAALAFGAWRGFREGFYVAAANFIGLLLSLVIAYFYYQPVAEVLLKIWTVPTSIAQVFGFLLLTFAVDGLATALILLAVSKLELQPSQPKFFQWLGMPFGFGGSLVTLAFIASLFTALPLEHPLKTSVTGSTLARPLAQTARAAGAPIDELVAPAISDLSQLFTISPDSKEVIQLPFTVQNPAVSPEDEAQMLVLLNRERTAHGLQPLAAEDQLRELARSYSLSMFQQGFFAHYSPDGKDPFDRMREAGITYQAAGENLALAPTVDMAHKGLMESPGHRRNILDPSYHHVGIGAYKDPRYGIIFTQVFTN